jgi:hypothetical protein
MASPVKWSTIRPRQISASINAGIFTFLQTGIMDDFDTLLKEAAKTQEEMYIQAQRTKEIAKRGTVAAAALKPVLLARHVTREAIDKATAARYRVKIQSYIWTRTQKDFYKSAMGRDVPEEMVRLRKNMVQHVYDIYMKIIDLCYPKPETAARAAVGDDNDDEEEQMILQNLREEERPLVVGYGLGHGGASPSRRLDTSSASTPSKRVFDDAFVEASKADLMSALRRRIRALPTIEEKEKMFASLQKVIVNVDDSDAGDDSD